MISRHSKKDFYVNHATILHLFYRIQDLPIVLFTVNLRQDKGRGGFLLSASPRSFRFIPSGISGCCIIPASLTDVLTLLILYPLRGKKPRVAWISDSVYAGPISVEIQDERFRIGFGTVGNYTGVIRLTLRYDLEMYAVFLGLMQRLQIR